MCKKKDKKGEEKVEPPEAPTWPPPSDVAGRGARAPTRVGPPVPPFPLATLLWDVGSRNQTRPCMTRLPSGGGGGGRRENGALSCMGSKPIGNDAALPIGPSASRLERLSSRSYNFILKDTARKKRGTSPPGFSRPKNQFTTLLSRGNKREKEVPLKIRRNRE